MAEFDEDEIRRARMMANMWRNEVITPYNTYDSNCAANYRQFLIETANDLEKTDPNLMQARLHAAGFSEHEGNIPPSCFRCRILLCVWPLKFTAEPIIPKSNRNGYNLESSPDFKVMYCSSKCHAEYSKWVAAGCLDL